jgi:hypothetical protein
MAETTKLITIATDIEILVATDTKDLPPSSPHRRRSPVLLILFGVVS